MSTFDVPNDLQHALAAQTLEIIRDARFALAGDIEALRLKQSNDLMAAKRATATTLLKTKPVRQWTAEDHLVFIEACEHLPNQPRMVHNKTVLFDGPHGSKDEQKIPF